MFLRHRFRFLPCLVALGIATLAPSSISAAPPPGIPDGWSDAFVYANGIRIHYYHAVPATGKPVIVMVHGVTDNGLFWATLTWKLQDAYDVYMLDARGHGLSDPFTPSDNADTLIKDVVEFVHAMKFEKPILLGHSMGAATVMRIGAEYPDLAKAIIMLDPGVGGRGPGGGPGPAAPAGGPATAGPGGSAPAPARPSFLSASPEILVGQNNDSFDELVAKAHRQNPKWDIVDCQYWALSKKQYHGPYTDAERQAMSGTMRTGDSLAKIPVPALILKADAPPEVRQQQLAAASVMQHGKLVHIDGAAHNLHHDQLARTVEVLKEFLSTTVSSTPQQLRHDIAAEKLGANPAGIAKIDALLQSYVDEQKLSSAVGFVAKGGNVVYERAFGWKDVENRVPATVDDYYVLMSQTKAITTVAFMTLVEQGKVAIDDPVSKYFPEIPDRVVTKVNPDGTYETRPVKSPMTFVHLMSHTSGLNAGPVGEIRRAQRKAKDASASVPGVTSTTKPSGQHSGGGDAGAKYLRDEMLDLVKYPLGFDPGTQYSYHVSSNMLGYLIERISGKPLREYVKETVLTPLGMNDTDWYYPPSALPRFVKAYRSVNGKLEPGSNIYSEGTISADQTYCEGALGLNGPIEDYAKFCQMLLNQGEFNGHRILQPKTVELMTTINRLPDNSGAGDGMQFGLGFEIHKTKKPVPAVSDSAFAWGGMMGTQYLIDPERDMIVLFYQNMHNAGPLTAKFYEEAYRLFDARAAVKSDSK
jgi:CubicO group peptidase (beta-lactamase class C family)/pimeloyl-ACP methyl ester carboxylesterase